MITTKRELAYYLDCDRIALGKKTKKPGFIGDEIWKIQICMRKLDYCSNQTNLKLPFMRLYYRFVYHKMSMKLGFSIPYDNIGPGLAIVHYGTIVISSTAKIGNNCRIHAGVNIGASGGQLNAAEIGNNVYIGPGAKIVGNVHIGNNCVIGANAVVVHDVPPSVTVGGIPAKIISQNDSSKHLIKSTEIIEGDNIL